MKINHAVFSCLSSKPLLIFHLSVATKHRLVSSGNNGHSRTLNTVLVSAFFSLYFQDLCLYRFVQLAVVKKVWYVLFFSHTEQCAWSAFFFFIFPGLIMFVQICTSSGCEKGMICLLTKDSVCAYIDMKYWWCVLPKCLLLVPD